MGEIKCELVVLGTRDDVGYAYHYGSNSRLTVDLQHLDYDSDTAYGEITIKVGGVSSLETAQYLKKIASILFRPEVVTQLEMAEYGQLCEFSIEDERVVTKVEEDNDTSTTTDL